MPRLTNRSLARMVEATGRELASRALKKATRRVMRLLDNAIKRRAQGKP